MAFVDETSCSEKNENFSDLFPAVDPVAIFLREVFQFINLCKFGRRIDFEADLLQAQPFHHPARPVVAKSNSSPSHFNTCKEGYVERWHEKEV